MTSENNVLHAAVRLQSDIMLAFTDLLSSGKVVGKGNTEIVQMLAQEAVHTLMISDVIKTEFKQWYETCGDSDD